MNTSLIRLTYCSRSVLSDTSRIEAMHEILDLARRNNARNGITGAIMLADNCFGQILEGEAVVVTETFDRIKHDPRHRSVVLLGAEKIAAQEFANWSMALAEEPREGITAAREIFVRAFAGDATATGDLQALIRSWLRQHAV